MCLGDVVCASETYLFDAKLWLVIHKLFLKVLYGSVIGKKKCSKKLTLSVVKRGRRLPVKLQISGTKKQTNYQVRKS